MIAEGDGAQHILLVVKRDLYSLTEDIELLWCYGDGFDLCTIDEESDIEEEEEDGDDAEGENADLSNQLPRIRVEIPTQVPDELLNPRMVRVTSRELKRYQRAQQELNEVKEAIKVNQ